jgi:hypothetical protein
MKRNRKISSNPPPNKPVWSENIAKRMAFLGISSVEKLSEKAGLPYPTVRDIVGGKSEGNYDNRSIIASALGLAVGDLYKETDKLHADITSNLQGTAEFLSRFANLPPVFQKMALTIIYQDPRYTAGIPLTPEAQAEIQKLFGPLLKAKT